jgi:IS4 transposase
MTAEQYERIPQWLQLRAVRVDVRQAGFRTKRLLLVTTLTDAEEVTGADLAELYRRRWQAEICHSDYRPSDRLCPGACAA